MDVFLLGVAFKQLLLIWIELLADPSRRHVLLSVELGEILLPARQLDLRLSLQGRQTPICDAANYLFWLQAPSGDREPI